MKDYDYFSSTFAPWSQCEEAKPLTAVIEEGVTSIGAFAFIYSTITSITIPSTVATVGWDAFWSARELSSVIWESASAPARISDGAFQNCLNLRTIRLPEGVTELGSVVFADSIALNTVFLPVREIGMNVFSNSDLRDVYYAGDSSAWAAVQKDGNDEFAQAQIHYNVSNYVVTFLANGGVFKTSGTERIQQGNNQTLTSFPANPTRSGYQFDGWYDRASGGNKLSRGSAFTPDTVVYAHWSKTYAFSTSQAKRELSTVSVTDSAPFKSSITTSYGSTYEAFNNGGRVLSQLFRNPDGTFRTVDDCEKEKVVYISEYSADYQLLSRKEIPYELSRFGGYYAGENYHFFVFGEDNHGYDNEKEVIRLVKYDQNYKRIASAAVSNCDTQEPFYFGSVRMEEHNGQLAVHTSRHLYNGHQAALMLVFDIDAMTWAAWVSHSFNQYVRYDGDARILLNHGDAYARGVIFHKANTADNAYQEINFFDIPGPTGDNWTGVSVGGLEISQEYYIAAINTVQQDAVVYAADGSHNHTLDSGECDAVLLFGNKENLRADGVRQDYLTHYYRSGTTAGTPYLVTRGIVLRVCRNGLYSEYALNKIYPYQWKRRRAGRSGSASRRAALPLLPACRGGKPCFLVCGYRGLFFRRADILLSGFDRKAGFAGTGRRAETARRKHCQQRYCSHVGGGLRRVEIPDLSQEQRQQLEDAGGCQRYQLYGYESGAGRGMHVYRALSVRRRQDADQPL